MILHLAYQCSQFQNDIKTEEDVVEMIQEIIQHVNTRVEEVPKFETTYQVNP